MKKMVLDINEMSDSKEVYGQRPNPFIVAFIYCLAGLLIAAAIYSCIGKIDIVATSGGIIRPNDDVSTVSSLIGGRITGVNYSDGQYVEAGDVLLTVNTAEAEISLNALKKTLEDYEKQLLMTGKFLDGIEEGHNPFSSDPSNEEYAYYIQYTDYELSLKNTKDTFDFDVQNAAANSQAASEQISDIENRIMGLTAYRESIESGSNLASSFPEYENMYLMYIASIDALALDYQTQREKILSDQTSESNQYYLDYYEGLITEYGYLVASIEKDRSVFPSGYSGTCLLLWNDYCANLDEYKRTYETAVADYDYYLGGGTALQTEVFTSEKELNPGKNFLDYNASVAKNKMESAEAAISAYKNRMLAEYKQKLSEYEIKTDELRISSSGIQDKEALLSEIESSYQNALEQKYFQTLEQIDSSIQSLKTEIISRESSLRLYQIASSLYQKNLGEDGIPISISLAAAEQISALLKQEESLNGQVDDLKTQIMQAEQQVAQGSILAGKSGTISVISTLVKGDTLTAGTPFATIIPPDESEYKVQLYVGSADIANVEVGDEIKYNITALPSSQYGLLTGKVRSISKDVLSQNGEYSGCYLVEGNVENKKLADRDGNAGKLAIGMQVEAKIVTERKTIIWYLLEKINLF